MRENMGLYRGKQTDNGKWICGYLLEQNIPDYHSYIVASFIAEQDNRHTEIIEYAIYEVIPETVGQYTGLTDKNGVKIFEGDIVSYFKKDILNSEVIYKDGCFMFRFISEFTQRMRQSKQEPIFDNVSMCGEVIGNIHDNSELMKGGENNA